MAASTTSESAPENFHISSSNDDDSHLSCNTIRCPLCNYSRKLFFCRACIRKGDFIHSSHHLSERFSEKQSKYLNLKSSHRNLETKCLQLLQRRMLCENFKAEIAQKRQNVTILKEIISNKKDSIKKGNDLKKALEDSNRYLRVNLPKYENNVKKLEDYVLSKVDNNEKRRENFNQLASQLKILRRSCIEKLIKYIFPISQAIHRSCGGNESDTSKDTISEISEATRTAYIRGQWILQDSFGELQHVIVAPSLPGNGDYSLYNDWISTTSKDGIPSGGGGGAGVGTSSSSSSSEIVTLNPAHRISAALTYTAQLVQVLSFYLNVRLPFKVTYSDFCTTTMSEANFTRKVARLNANIFYICYSQKCKLSLMNPNHSLENIQHLLNTNFSDLGRTGNVEVSNCVDETTDLILAHDIDAGEDSGSEDENNFQQEWEAVPHLSSLENVTPIITGNPNHSASMAGGLVTSAVASVASFWRGWTGK